MKGTYSTPERCRHAREAVGRSLLFLPSLVNVVLALDLGRLSVKLEPVDFAAFITHLLVGARYHL